ncbi:MAG: CCA tRNA nucleotidyltransferase [Phycisphaerales bacterium]
MPAGDDPIRARSAATEIVRALRRAGHVAYFAGGCVRDELLGTPPSDYDVATDAPPERVVALFPGSGLVGASFGVVIVRAERHAPQVEVATFRVDGRYDDARRPSEVTFSDARADAERRDFTVNALFLDPLDTPSPQAPAVAGRVIDHVGGLADLAARTIRAVGDPGARLTEDHLRALRAARFAARLGFTIEPRTAEAIRRHAAELAGVSRERIGDELRRMLAATTAPAAARALQDLRLDRPVLGDAAGPGGQAPPVVFPALQNTATLCSFTGSLAAWLIDRAGADGLLDAHAPRQTARALRTALLLSNDEVDALTNVLTDRVTFRTLWPTLGVAVRKRLASRPSAPAAMAAIDGEASPVAGVIRQACADMGVTLGECGPEPFLDGTMLIGLGLSPGPVFKKVLDRVYDAQLEGRVRSKQDALELARSLSVQ